MPSYLYEVVDAEGKHKKSTIEANTIEQATYQLKNEGYIITSIREAGMLEKDIQIGGNKKLTPRDLSVFCRQFEGILSAGVTVINALDMLYEQAEQPTLKKALHNVKTAIQKGETLAGAMGEEDRAFPSIMVNMVAAGEASGNLEVAFERLAVQFEKSARLNSMVKKAMIYPIAIVFVAIVVVIIMMAVVVPKFSAMFAGMGEELPFATRLVVAISDFIIAKWYILLLAAAIIVVAWKIFASSDYGIHFNAKMMMKLPLFGELTLKSACAGLARTLSTLMASGMSLIEAIDITAKTMKNVIIQESLMEAKEEVTKGMALSAPLYEAGIFPTLICQMIKIGEETGNLESMLDRLADYYDEEVENATQALSAAMEPAIICVLAVLVGGIVAAVYSPILTMYESVGNA